MGTISSNSGIKEEYIKIIVTRKKKKKNNNSRCFRFLFLLYTGFEAELGGKQKDISSCTNPVTIKTIEETSSQINFCCIF